MHSLKLRRINGKEKELTNAVILPYEPCTGPVWPFSQSTTVYKIKFLVIQHCHKLYLEHTTANADPVGCMSNNATQTAIKHNVTVPAFIVLMSVTAVNHL
jgi:hypothetical protein